MPEDRGEGLRLVYAGSPSSQKECLDLIVKAVEEFSPKHKVELVIAGITLSEFNSIYHMNYAGNSVKFLGKIENNKVISLLKSADYSIIIRENNRVVQAGFPTKIVESISAGTPVIVNDFGNVTDYLNEENSIIADKNNLIDAFQEALLLKKKPDSNFFHYKKWVNSLAFLFK